MSNKGVPTGSRIGALRLVITTILSVMVFALFSTSLHANECSHIPANANIVEVSVDKQTLSGSGVLLTFDGYIVTAAHVLLGKIKPPIPLRYFVRLQAAPNEPTERWRGASLRKVNRDLDLAVLKLDDLPRRPSLVASSPSSSASIGTDVVCLSGFGLRKDASGAVIRLGFTSIPSRLLPDETGYLIPDKKVASGFSGGGIFHNGRFAGLIVRRRIQGGSYVVPGSYVTDFAGSLGIYIDDQGRFAPGVATQALRREIQGNRKSIDDNIRQLARIFRSMKWDISLLPPNDGDGFKIALRPERAFPDQILDGYFIGDLTVHFDDDGFRQRLQQNGEIHKAVVAVKIAGGEVLIENIERDIVEIKGKYLAEGLQLIGANVSKFVINGRINYHGWSRGPIIKELSVDHN